MLTPDQERMAEALAIQRIYGAEGPFWIASRIGALAIAADAAGVERFTAIAAQYEKLLRGTVQ